VTLATFALATNLQELLSQAGFYGEWYRRYPFYVPEGVKTTLQILLVVAVTAALHRRGVRGTAAELGLTRPVLPALALALVATAPLLVGLALRARRVDPAFAPAEVFYTAGYSSFAEDLVYTGFAVRQLHRRAGWPFRLAVLGVAVTFGLGHVEKGRTLAEMAALFAFTGAGLAAFAWLFLAWGDNLWVPVAMHVLLDLWWAVFGAGSTAIAGGPVPMALAGVSVAAALALTLVHRRPGRTPAGPP
jgi:membrane protease YdiL (CAAX protease family)